MKENRLLNAGVGAFVLLAAVSMMFLAFFASTPDWRGYDGYTVYAKFDEAAGLRARAPIRIAGVRIGEVESVELTPSYQAKVALRIDSKSTELPLDTTAHIFTEGLLGVRYVAIFPGYDESTLKHDDEILQTNSGFVLENLIAQFLINLGSESLNKGSSDE
ncbi:outer membrane lipid asymmetry maintenance protein MlaD [Candidatus Comchoanobacter bicostacola]|uniref:Outer membrane lipid asymmetry maintenance protein MlaD n=1 Tax=Candidatus Comchoanobacter bicostacola TaxID=2919598 RepID=A0ABY5DIL0_9GAMM|nr:outer membrane lipid asymmetry maintenance protein MlaD [Candidatus Comchoanobacter bicostacola]UTC24451.1 outer membrane lipid asymmetry maintenance protein MlaD [Candidatus Comchoanobacter bicostacola]